MKYFLILLVSMMTLNSYGQRQICGTHDDGSMMKRLEANKLLMAQQISNRSDNDWIYIPLQFHIVTPANGEGGIDELKILDELCTINKNYTPHKMKFYLTPEFNYIQNNALYDDPGSAFAEAKIKTSKNKSAVNIFLVNDIGSGSSPGQILGYFSPLLDVVVIRNNQVGINAQTVSHELGHFFSLAHPFDGWGETPYNPATHGNPVNILTIKENGKNYVIEFMNKSNCNDAADKLCDTPPDYNFGLVDPEQDCKLNGPFLDYNQDTIVTMENNYMGYFFNCGKYQFTPMQEVAMRADYLHTLRSYIRTGVIPDTMLIDPATFNVVSPQNNEITTYFNEVTLDWDDMPNASDYVVTIYAPSDPSNIFKYFVKTSEVTVTELAKNKKYYWHVRPFNNGNTCNSKLGGYSFKTGGYGVGIHEEFADGEDFTIFPNPVTNQQVYIYSKKSVKNIEVEVYNSLGQLVDSINTDLAPGSNSLNLNKSNYLNGFYNLVLKTNEGDYIRKIIIQ